MSRTVTINLVLADYFIDDNLRVEFSFLKNLNKATPNKMLVLWAFGYAQMSERASEIFI